VQRDSLGNAIGGVRTAANDVPVAALSGVANPGSSGLCSLFGGTRPFDQATLIRLYGNKANYLDRFVHATIRAVRHGYVLRADTAAIITEASKVDF
jgi:alpha/beta hydrolase family protein